MGVGTYISNGNEKYLYLYVFATREIFKGKFPSSFIILLSIASPLEPVLVSLSEMNMANL